MATEGRQFCTHCLRTVIRLAEQRRWVHEDTGEIWCARVGLKFAEPRRAG